MEYKLLGLDDQHKAFALLSYAHPGVDPSTLIPPDAAVFAAMDTRTEDTDVVRGVMTVTPVIVLGAHLPIAEPDLDPQVMLDLIESHLPDGTVYYMLVPDGPGASLPESLGLTFAGSVNLYTRTVVHPTQADIEGTTS